MSDTPSVYPHLSRYSKSTKRVHIVYIASRNLVSSLLRIFIYPATRKGLVAFYAYPRLSCVYCPATSYLTFLLFFRCWYLHSTYSSPVYIYALDKNLQFPEQACMYTSNVRVRAKDLGLGGAYMTVPNRFRVYDLDILFPEIYFRVRQLPSISNSAFT